MRGQPSPSELWFIFSNHFDEGGICREILGQYASEYRKNGDLIKNADVIGNLCIKLKSNIVVLHYGLVFWRDWGIWRDFTKDGQFYPPPACGIWDPK